MLIVGSTWCIGGDDNVDIEDVNRTRSADPVLLLNVHLGVCVLQCEYLTECGVLVYLSRTWRLGCVVG